MNRIVYARQMAGFSATNLAPYKAFGIIDQTEMIGQKELVLPRSWNIFFASEEQSPVGDPGGRQPGI